MIAAYWALALFGLAGHALLWVEFVNHAHATRMPRWAVWSLTLVAYAFLFGAPLLGALLWFNRSTGAEVAPGPLPTALAFYAWLCVAAGAVLVPLAIWHRWPRRLPQASVTDTERRDLARSLGLAITGGPLVRLMNYVPGNEALRLELTRKTLFIPKLPSALDGLTLCHLTDLHYTGRIPRRYFEEVVDCANAWAPDLALITGDIVDKAACMDWLAPTLGRLRARHGRIYILGNHDRRVRIGLIHQQLSALGLLNVGGRTHVLEVNGAAVLLAGNELPWLPPAADMARSPLQPGATSHLRLLLAHSPDQIAWARAHQFDVMVCGHNHGGQIALPVVGPVAVPSRHGVKYAAGLFYEAPTLLHVSRGISAELPLRLGCPPELALLELRVPESSG